eukprot:468917-Amphidinium_carterae.1
MCAQQRSVLLLQHCLEAVVNILESCCLGHVLHQCSSDFPRSQQQKVSKLNICRWTVASPSCASYAGSLILQVAH